MQMSTSSVLSTPPPTPPMENPSNISLLHQVRTHPSKPPPPPPRTTPPLRDRNSTKQNSKPLTDSTSKSSVTAGNVDCRKIDPKITKTSDVEQTEVVAPSPNGSTVPSTEEQHRSTDSLNRNTRTNRSRSSDFGSDGGSVGGAPPHVSRFLTSPEEYFRGVSPMCRRLLEDMATVRDSWGQDWSGLTYDQQCKILDQAIVDEVGYWTRALLTR